MRLTRKLKINRLYWPVTSLGFGQRAGIWFQGCSIGCTGCGSQHTWRVENGKEASVGQIMEWLESLPVEALNGITVSGGEPFEQPHALMKLLSAIRGRCGERDDFDVLVYSGYTWRKIQRGFPGALEFVDALISGPYVHKREKAWLRGSDNQELHTLSKIGHRRYGNDSDRADDSPLQVVVDGEEIRIIGIPARGDLRELSRRLARRGIQIRDTSY